MTRSTELLVWGLMHSKVSVMAIGSLVLKVPGVLDPVCVCLEALGGSIGQKVPKRLLQLCQKAAATKENWQVQLLPGLLVSFASIYNVPSSPHWGWDVPHHGLYPGTSGIHNVDLP